VKRFAVHSLQFVARQNTAIVNWRLALGHEGIHGIHGVPNAVNGSGHPIVSQAGIHHP
jgi:hypothetical protein